ncbi:MAG: CBS domain-containing protein [Candidatus Heimdallarchaeota archaeon]|nr:MAG: CBS domain-containing protein [Candidatus Heimdallarchaeota archaeon]
MIKCTVCGHENLPGSLYCSNCNSDIVVGKRKPLTDSRIEKAILEDSLEEVGGIESLALEVPHNMPVKEVVRLMIDQQKCSVVVVGSEKSIEGIFTERSLLRRVCNEIPINLEKPIREVMLKSPVVLKKTDTVAYALHMMEVQGYSYAIIEDDPIRVINIRNILHYIVELHPSLGGFDKVLNGFKEAVLKKRTLSEEEREIIKNLGKNKELFYRAFTVARNSGKLGETERITRENFLNNFLPAVKEISKQDEHISPDESAVLGKLVKLFEEEKDYFLPND